MNTRAAYGHLADSRYRVGVPPNAGKLPASWASSSRQSTAGCRALVVAMVGAMFGKTFSTVFERPRGRVALWDGMVAGAAPGLQSLGEVETSQVGSTPTPSRHLSSRHLFSRRFWRHVLVHRVSKKLVPRRLRWKLYPPVWMSRFCVPAGRGGNSPALQCREADQRWKSPGGTAEMLDIFSRPSGTCVKRPLFPALKCRAISKLPLRGADHMRPQRGFIPAKHFHLRRRGTKKLQSASSMARMSVRAVHRFIVHRQRSLTVLHVVTKEQS